MRSTIDKLLASLGLALAALLLVGGGLLTWASTFVGDQVSSQLSQQDITMPTEQTGLAALPAEDKAALEPFAGQQMTTGDQAHAYADHYIAAHMKKSSGGKTFSQIGEEVRAACPKQGSTDAPSQQCTELRGLQNTLFQGNTLRGLLLNAYAFGTMGKIAGLASIAAYIGSAVMLLLSLLGFRHAKRANDAGVTTSTTSTNTAGATRV